MTRDEKLKFMADDLFEEIRQNPVVNVPSTIRLWLDMNLPHTETMVHETMLDAQAMSRNIVDIANIAKENMVDYMCRRLVADNVIVWTYRSAGEQNLGGKILKAEIGVIIPPGRG